MSDHSDLTSLPDIFGMTHPGAVRTENEDAIDWWIDRKTGLCICVLADGMGGHHGGAYASKLALSSIRKSISDNVQSDFLDQIIVESILIEAAEAANESIQHARQSEPEFSQMGTTLVLVAIWQFQVLVLHVGDSRCYLIEACDPHIENKMPEPAQLTRDDSVVQSMLDEGVITQDDVPNIPYRNRLTNALGINSTLRYQILQRELNPGDVLLICSDGFHQAVAMEQIANTVAAISKDTVEELLQVSLDNKTDDNTSLILAGYKPVSFPVQRTQEM
jgi:serine/threonine protein phosphatase PrpC